MEKKKRKIISPKKDGNNPRVKYLIMRALYEGMEVVSLCGHIRIWRGKFKGEKSDLFLWPHFFPKEFRSQMAIMSENGIGSWEKKAPRVKTFILTPDARFKNSLQWALTDFVKVVVPRELRI